MSCRWFRKRLVAYVDEELPQRQREMLARHLEACSACRREAERLRALAPVLQDIVLPDFPEELTARILATAERQLARRGNRWSQRLRVEPILPPWGMRTAAAAVLLLGITIGSVLGENTWPKWIPAPAPPARGADVAAVYALDAFDAAPSGSLEAGFLGAARTNGGGK